MLCRFFMRGGWIAGGRSLVDAKRRSFDRADSGDASATPEASKFAFVSERTSSLAGREVSINLAKAVQATLDSGLHVQKNGPEIDCMTGINAYAVKPMTTR